MARAKKSKKRVRFPLKKDQRLGWHLLSSWFKLGYQDNRKVKVGQKISLLPYKDIFGNIVNPVPMLCKRGMHASHKIHKTMRDVGRVMCRVLVEGDIQSNRNKFCGRSRTILWAMKVPDKIWDNYYWDLYQTPQRGAQKALEAWAKKNGCPYMDRDGRKTK